LTDCATSTTGTSHRSSPITTARNCSIAGWWFTEVGLFVGLSSGAIMAGAVKCANTIGDDDVATIVTIVADDGWKYLSTGAWSDNIDDVVERAKSIIYF
jgi:cysteine synthase